MANWGRIKSPDWARQVIPTTAGWARSMSIAITTPKPINFSTRSIKGTFVGDAYLGSEQDYIVKNGVACYKFGKGYYEADAGDKYSFKYSYGNGDYYLGYVYQSPGGTYYPGYKFTTMKNELGLLGYYQILSMTYTGDTAKYNQVFVDKYHDGETNKNFTPVHQGQPVGKTSLGSELDYICVDKVLAYRFGIYRGVFYEADVGDRYAFKYSYGNGDYYQGYVYRSPGSVYYPGYKFTTNNKTRLRDLPDSLHGLYRRHCQIQAGLCHQILRRRPDQKVLQTPQFHRPHGHDLFKERIGLSLKTPTSASIDSAGATTRPTPATPTPSAIPIASPIQTVTGTKARSTGTPPVPVYYPGWKKEKKNETGQTGYWEILRLSYTGETDKIRPGLRQSLPQR